MSPPGSDGTARQRLRSSTDWLAARLIAGGGIGVIVAVMLIFFYLLWVVAPIFAAPRVEGAGTYESPLEAPPVVLALDERGEYALAFDALGRGAFFAAASGLVSDRLDLGLPPGARATAVAGPTAGTGVVGLGLDDGSVHLLRIGFEAVFEGELRRLQPRLDRLLVHPPSTAGPVQSLAFATGEEGATLVAGFANELLIDDYEFRQSLLGGELQPELLGQRRLLLETGPDFLQVTGDRRHLYAAQRDGRLMHFALPSGEALGQTLLVPPGEELQSLELLLGGYSLLAGGRAGGVTQWSPVRDATDRLALQPMRRFDTGKGAVALIRGEHRRRGFFVVTDDGELSIYHSTAHRRLFREQVTPDVPWALALAPRGDRALAVDGTNRFSYLRIANEHPEISLSALWSRVWYEGYPEPEFVWQSSAADNDFEPKFSLTPLVFGTFKAALFAMLFAVPLAVMGAIFTAQFMAPRLRRSVKPAIELMQAMPTVILGFLAGLWLAPIIETNLPGTFALVIALPPAFVAAAWLMSVAPPRLQRLSTGYEPLWLVPVVLLVAYLALDNSAAMERALFGGNIQQWLDREFGLGFDQRNAMVVGIAMGFAVIPTIFSIAEDAIFGVPQHLVRGSQALGASDWQTLVRVVLPTASPGIASAIMMGLGRAVGETMIVLMATGNTPIMDFNLFEGMRTLSANIAVEVPESEHGSTHYRILFLAAIVLFAMTFVLNTAAEVVRARLRSKYGNL